jgi:hypothetical protein
MNEPYKHPLNRLADDMLEEEGPMPEEVQQLFRRISTSNVDEILQNNPGLRERYNQALGIDHDPDPKPDRH